jgi:threonyl-tRNA synthetase
MPVITLPDGSRREYPQPLTVADIAASIGPGLARAALAGRVNGKLVDTSFRVEQDAEVAIITDKSPEGVEIIRHSTAHLLAQAVKELFPEAQVTIGPVIERLLLRFRIQTWIHGRGSGENRAAHARDREARLPRQPHRHAA